MQLANLGVELQKPIVALSIGMHEQSKISAHAEVVTAREAQRIRERGVTPG